ncbi:MULTISPECIES: TonB-dependent siderophore receptor [unclassified Caulobacter]|uniref:TonB-dependent receptor plug domain-containing protein n=1 Tax=unclassified Caulobacter TaxID=2648921 RepID=UPI0006FC5010|nr:MULTISPECIES: TonB-dependent receptor [unclassified Caulobacter]KQV57249.1 TonB-dependent receptor [Caulobacter sp. Root342]KQV66821.1 TonB-dependent receptor [Caulobacter sp. Root343]
MIRAFFSSTALATILISGSAMADDQKAPEADVAGKVGANGVAELVVTATRTAQPIEKVGASVTVLTQGAIEASQAISITDLLAQQPGVSFTRNGGPGTSTSLNIRGAETQHTVVLIDGVKLNDPSSTQGGFNSGNLLVGDISRIEILRGAQSTLWGSQAIGGVVNIVTADPTAPFTSSADVEVGARKTGYVRGGLGGATDKVVWRLAGGYYTTDGFSTYKTGTEKDGYQNAGASGRVRVQLTDNVSAEVRSVYSRGKNDFDGFAGDSAEFGRTKELVVYSGLNFALLDGRFNNRVGYAYTDTDRANYNPARSVPMTFDSAGKNKRWEYQGVFAVTDTWTASFGAESERSRMRTRSPTVSQPLIPFRTGKVGVDSVYGQLQAEVVPGLTLTAGLRYEDHDTYGSHTLGQASAAWALNEGNTVLRASFGQGFRAPGLYELYSEYGNLALSPEDFDSWDAGVEQRFLGGKARASATWFHREADNEIRFFSCVSAADPLCAPGGSPRFGYYNNVQKTKAQGLELIGELKPVDGLTLTGNYTYTDAESNSGANKGKQLTRRPKNMANLSATYRWPVGLTTTVAVRHVGKTYNNDANTQVVASYTTVDLRAAYPLKDGLEVFGRVENAFDKDYQTILNYGTPGRGAFVGLRARF